MTENDNKCTAPVREDVKVLQKCLRRLGYFPVYAPNGKGKIKINGKFCYYTQLALKNFQKNHKLAQTGKFDKKTQEALIKAVCPANTSKKKKDKDEDKKNSSDSDTKTSNKNKKSTRSNTKSGSSKDTPTYWWREEEEEAEKKKENK